MKLIENLDALLRRQESLRDKIAQARIAKQKADKRDEEKEFAVIGETVVSHAKDNPEFKLAVKKILASAPIDEPSKKFLSSRGWGL